jgi:hypothetical protein
MDCTLCDDNVLEIATSIPVRTALTAFLDFHLTSTLLIGARMAVEFGV